MYLFGKNLNNETVLVAEIGLNHEGKLSKAKTLIDLAKKGGADAVKFQSYTLDNYCSIEDKKRYKMLKRFNFTKDQFLKIFNYCKKRKIHYFSTAVTEDYVDFLSKKTEVIKIASGDSTFKPTLLKAAKSKAKIILSTGGTTFKEILNTIKYLKKNSKLNLKRRLAILHCISAYPAPINELNLNSIIYLKKKTGLIVGYSNHSPNPNVIPLAIDLGAKIIEVHFTNDKNNKSIRDHALSFDFQDLKNISEFIRTRKKIFGKIDKRVQKSEIENILTIRKGIIASKKIKKFKIISKNDLKFARPAKEFSYSKLKNLIGRKIKNGKKKGEIIKKSDF